MFKINLDRTSDCYKGTIYYSKDELPQGKEAGYLNYGQIVDKENTFLVYGILVDEKYRHKGVATSMYKELCKISRECGIEFVFGRTDSTFALKSRTKVFGEPTSIMDKNFRKAANNSTEAERLLSSDVGESLWIMSKTEGCKSI